MKNIKLHIGDITKLEVDVIVNAANEELLGGGGVDGAIHQAAGPELLEECKEVGGCPTGEVVMTEAYNLPCKNIIHAVGPKWSGGAKSESEFLESCYFGAMELALENGHKSIAFPNISTGIYGYPKIEAAITATSAVKSFDRIDEFEEIIFCCFDDENFKIYESIL